jgi:RNA binding exosome subunit
MQEVIQMNEENHVIHKDGQVSTDKVDNAIEKIAPEEREQILQNFDAFKEYLGKRIAMGESIGLSEEQMAKIAEKVADHLAANEEPRNREEKLLQELWNVGKEDERHMLAHMLVRLAQSSTPNH